MKIQWSNKPATLSQSLDEIHRNVFFFRFRIMKTEISIRSDRCFALYPLYYLAFSH